MLAELEVTGHIFRVGFQELLEMRGGGIVVTELHAFQRQSVARESVRGFFGDKLLQNFPAWLLCLGHRLKTRIIAGLRARAKRAHFESKFRRKRGSNGANVKDEDHQE